MESVLTAIGVVFLAELGDKTQLVALGLGARNRLGPVLTGVAIGYLVATTLSVAIGAVLGAALPTTAVQIGGGLAFLGFALWTLRGSDDGAARDDGEPGAASNGTGAIVLRSAIALFVAELGDKTMFATATLAADARSAVAVWVGASIGILAAGAVGVVIGRVAGRALPERPVRLASAALFAVFGVLLLVQGLS
ncbi:TMEM165/GDT1 family protein [Euzebya tangerina]|uniref:TMEM165/GDT1 family protein n=1 Tax=Euzebya tangerina TaxID=591198 RepID=UPI000E30E36C|nr:TMEM165/GDT1 family protein [Euzebya tangerina]